MATFKLHGPCPWLGSLGQVAQTRSMFRHPRFTPLRLLWDGCPLLIGLSGRSPGLTTYTTPQMAQNVAWQLTRTQMEKLDDITVFMLEVFKRVQHTAYVVIGCAGLLPAW